MNSRNQTIFYGQVYEVGMKLSLMHNLYSKTLDTKPHSVARPDYMEENLYPFFS